MADIEIAYSSELMIAQVEGLTEPGVEFVDAWVEEEMYVDTTGRVFLWDTTAFQREALRQGLRLELLDVVWTQPRVQSEDPA